jgi:hypothetical protein
MANPGVKGLRKLQLGKETTSGTAAAATTIWRGEGVIEDTLLIVHPPEDIGYLSGVDRTYNPLKGAKLSLTSTPATFEQICYILEMGMKTATPVQDGSGSAYARTYTLPTTAQNVIKTYTIEGGDDITAGQERMEYCFVTDFELAFKAGEALMMSATIEGRQVSLSNFTGGLNLPAIEEILGSKGKLYIDAVGGTIGTTQASNTVLAGSLKIKTGLVAVPTADGNLYFSFVKSTMPDVVLEITFEHEGTSETERVAWRAQTPRKIRLIFTGNTLTTSGTTGGYTNKQLIIDVAGKYEKFSALQDSDGNDTVAATFRVRYDATAALFCQIVAVNELSALT